MAKAGADAESDDETTKAITVLFRGATGCTQPVPQAADRLPRSPALSAEIPEPGELLGDFRLLAELGRGSAGKTFLAAQPSLADRPVVLKVTALDHDEHLSLARLQHTHIVPLYSEQVFPDRALRALCMPFLGGATLDLVLDELAAIPHGRRRGADILSALDRLDSATIKGVEPKAIGSEPSVTLMEPGSRRKKPGTWGSKTLRSSWPNRDNDEPRLCRVG